LIGFSVFAQMTAQCPYTLQSDTPFPLLLPLPVGGDLDPHLIHVSLVNQSPQPKRHLNWCSYFCRAHWCDRPTDWPTDHAPRSVTTGTSQLITRSTRRVTSWPSCFMALWRV